jgi:hypothetical protein
MSCAKFLSLAGLCAGLLSFVAASHAAQPDSDYDLEPMLRRFNSESSQVVATDDESSPEMMPLATDDGADSKTANAPHRASPVSYDASGNDSRLCDLKEPALLPSSAIAASARVSTRPNSDWPMQSVRRDVKQAGLSTASTYGVATSDDMSQPPMPSGPGSRSIQTQQPQPPTSAATNAWVGDGNTQNNHNGPTDAGPRSTPEAIQSGIESSDCDQCSDCCDNDWFNPCGCCGWFAGADYLLMRPDFSDAPAFVRITGTPPATLTYTMIQQKFDYQSSVRTFFGYRDECGDEIRFTYWNLNDGGTLVVTPGVDVAYGGQFMTRANVPGDFLTNTANLEMNVYDIDYIKCCCNPCGCQSCCCPVWTLSYSAGVRIASERRTDNTIQSLATPTSEPTAGFISASFVGAGPRVGIEGHRYFRDTRMSLFARSHIALLLGEYDTEQSVLVTTPTPAVTHLINDHDRIIPEADIEIGGDWQMTSRLKLSAGYLFQAWWDLGEFEQVGVSGAGFIQPELNSNILGFDGLFARLEYCF